MQFVFYLSNLCYKNVWLIYSVYLCTYISRLVEETRVAKSREEDFIDQDDFNCRLVEETWVDKSSEEDFIDQDNLILD